MKIFRYVTESTFDSYSWQLIENKQKFIGQIMTSKSPVRSCEDLDEAALTYAEVKALATGNPHMKEKMDLDIQVGRLKLMKAGHTSQRYRLEEEIRNHYPVQIAALERQTAGLRQDAAQAQKALETAKEYFSMVIRGRVCTDQREAGLLLTAACSSLNLPVIAETIGEFHGFSLEAGFDSSSRKYLLTLRGQCSHTMELGKDPWAT